LERLNSNKSVNPIASRPGGQKQLSRPRTCTAVRKMNTRSSDNCDYEITPCPPEQTLFHDSVA